MVSLVNKTATSEREKEKGKPTDATTFPVQRNSSNGHRRRRRRRRRRSHSGFVLMDKRLPTQGSLYLRGRKLV